MGSIVPALPNDFVAAIRCPVLCLFGGADRVVLADTAAAIGSHLPRSSEIAVYERQPHGYFEKDLRTEAGHEEAAADSWERLRAFLRRAGAADQ
jgi:carboxymethylenebutenolidase